jgi:hypothetical protein
MLAKRVHFFVTFIPICGLLNVSFDKLGVPNEFYAVNSPSITGIFNQLLSNTAQIYSDLNYRAKSSNFIQKIPSSVFL